MSTINSVNSNISTLTQTYSTVNSQENTQENVQTTEETATTPVDTVEISSAAKSASTSKSKSTSQKSTVDTAAIQKAIRESEQKMSQFKSLVEKLFKKQGKTSYEADWDTLAKAGKLGEALSDIEVDSTTKAQAQADIAEDGYWGVEKTSERILDFAKALAGNDSSKADALLEAYKKGFEAAEEAWGGKDKLPEICYKTHEAVLKGFEDWKNEGSTSSTSNMEDVSYSQIIAQAGNGVMGN